MQRNFFYSIIFGILFSAFLSILFYEISMETKGTCIDGFYNVVFINMNKFGKCNSGNEKEEMYIQEGDKTIGYPCNYGLESFLAHIRLGSCRKKDIKALVYVFLYFCIFFFFHIGLAFVFVIIVYFIVIFNSNSFLFTIGLIISLAIFFDIIVILMNKKKLI